MPTTKYFPQLFLNSDGSCRWDGVRRYLFEGHDSSFILRRDAEEEAVWSFLLEKGILTLDVNNNHIIIRSGNWWGPYLYGRHLAFTNYRDAFDYFNFFHWKHGGLDGGPAQIITCTNVLLVEVPK